MISLFRKTLGAAILLTGLAAPALAHPYDGGGYGYDNAPRSATPYYGDDGWRRHEEHEAMWRAQERREAYWHARHDDAYGYQRGPWDH